MKSRYRLMICIFCAAVAAVQALGADTRFAFVQYRVEKGNYSSETSFQADIETLVSTAAGAGAECVVFPEYINVFLSLLPLADELQGAHSVDDGLGILHRRYGENTGLKDYFILQSPEVKRIMDRVWGGAAEKYRVWIVAGTAFIAEEDSQAGAGLKTRQSLSSEQSEQSEPPRLHNQLSVYNPRGEVIYTQNKVYLTPFEKNILSLDAGLLEQAEICRIGNIECGLTICRDTFFEEWEDKFEKVDLWMDLKANGDIYDHEAVELFERALPERVRQSGVKQGATICLNGDFMELFWEGRSSVIKALSSGEGYEVVIEAVAPDEEEILFYTVEDEK